MKQTFVAREEGKTDFSLLQIFQTDSVIHLAFYSMGTAILSRRLNRRALSNPFTPI